MSISENAPRRRPTKTSGYQPPVGGGWQQIGRQQNRGGNMPAEQVQEQQQMQQQQQSHMSSQMGGELISLRPGAHDPNLRPFQGGRPEHVIQMGGNDFAIPQPDAKTSRKRLIRRVEQHMYPQPTSILG